MIKKIITTLMNQYGRSEEKETKKLLVMVVLIFLFINFFVINILPKGIQGYLGCIEITMIITFISQYFFRKSNNAHKYKKLKVICYFFSLTILLVISLPIILIAILIDFFADVTNKIYVIKRNPYCAIVETIYHFSFGVILLQQTILYADNIMVLFATYVVLLAGDRFLCWIFRIVLIRGKNKYYERYQYQMEMDVVGEYIFLGVTTISILYSATNYSYVFMPLLLWYSLKQIRKFWLEKKCQNVINEFLLGSLKQLQELECIYLESMLTEEIKVIEYIENVKKVKFYKEYNSKRKFYHYCSRKRAEIALEKIENIGLQKYIIPKDKEKARAEIEAVMNSIVRCVI